MHRLRNSSDQVQRSYVLDRPRPACPIDTSGIFRPIWYRPQKNIRDLFARPIEPMRHLTRFSHPR